MACATSSGSTLRKRASGMVIPEDSSVLTTAGSTVVSVTPVPASSERTAAESPTTACLLAT